MIKLGAIKKCMIGLAPRFPSKKKCRAKLTTLEMKVGGQRSMMTSSPS